MNQAGLRSSFRLHPSSFPTLQGRWCDQAKLGIENVDEVVEIPRASRITRGFEQFVPGSQLPLDVGAAFRKQRFQYRLGRFLMKAMFRRRGRGS